MNMMYRYFEAVSSFFFSIMFFVGSGDIVAALPAVQEEPRSSFDSTATALVEGITSATPTIEVSWHELRSDGVAAGVTSTRTVLVVPGRPRSSMTSRILTPNISEFATAVVTQWAAVTDLEGVFSDQVSGGTVKNLAEDIASAKITPNLFKSEPKPTARLQEAEASKHFKQHTNVKLWNGHQMTNDEVTADLLRRDRASAKEKDAKQATSAVDVTNEIDDDVSVDGEDTLQTTDYWPST